MLWWQIICIVCIVSTVLFGIILPAYGDEYRTLGIRHADNPVVCVFEPHPLFTDNQGGIVQASYNAIDLWKEKISEHAPNGNWEMPVYTIPHEDHVGKYPDQFQICNILISFEYVNTETRSLGFTSLNFQNSNHKFTHIVAFTHNLDILTHFKLNLGTLEHEKINTSISIEPFTLTAIQNIITHEFGHALGLGHYKITDYPIYTADTPWVNASVMYYSMNPDNNKIMIPKFVDIRMLEKIYTEDGFGGAIAPTLKAGYYSAGDDDVCTHKCNFTQGKWWQ